jgi:outer membrane translocation and assembly module TamA
MSKEVRMLTASKDVQALVDKGYEVNVKFENASFEDKAIKAKIKEFVENKIEKDESNVAVSGLKAQAVVTVVESYELAKSNGAFEIVKKNSVEGGFLANAVKRDVKLAVPPSDIEKAVKILGAAGIGALVSESYKIEPKEFRALKDASLTRMSDEEKEARNALVKCAKRDVTYRLKYEELPAAEDIKES